MSERIKGQGHQLLTAQKQKDWQQMFLLHKSAFDGLLYLPIEDDAELNPDIEQPLFGQLNDHQDREAYSDAEPVSIIEVKGEDAYGLVASDTGESLGFGEGELFKCRLSALHVPDGSAISYKESVGSRVVIRTWYVHRSIQVAYAHLDEAKIYFCIPFDIDELEKLLGDSDVI